MVLNPPSVGCATPNTPSSAMRKLTAPRRLILSLPLLESSSDGREGRVSDLRMKPRERTEPFRELTTPPASFKSDLGFGGGSSNELLASAASWGRSGIAGRFTGDVGGRALGGRGEVGGEVGREDDLGRIAGGAEVDVVMEGEDARAGEETVRLCWFEAEWGRSSSPELVPCLRAVAISSI
jgi:hypothetical protein